MTIRRTDRIRLRYFCAALAVLVLLLAPAVQVEIFAVVSHHGATNVTADPEDDPWYWYGGDGGGGGG